MSNILNALGYGATVAVIGIAIVFLGLGILIAAIYLLSGLLRKMLNAKSEKKAAAPAPAPAPAPVPVAEPVVEEAEVVDDAELIAVIAAAIAAFDNSGKRLVVRKVRRVSAWNKSSREEQVCRF